MRALTMPLVALLASCAMPTRAEIDAAPIGDAPPTETIENSVSGYLSARLRDPGSAMVSLSPPLRGCYRPGMFSSAKFAWRVEASVNARNGFGGYTGPQQWFFFFLADSIVAVLEPGQVNGQRFHELVELGGGVSN